MAGRSKPVRLADVVTRDAVDEERIMLRLALEPDVDPSLSSTQRVANRRAASEAAEIIGLAALVWLKRTRLTIYSALVDAGTYYVQSGASRATRQLKIRKPLSGKSFERWAGAPRLCQLHQIVLAYLQVVWQRPPTLSNPRAFRGVSHRGPYGEAQHLGTQKWQAQLRERAAAVDEILAALRLPVDPKTARRWVTDLKRPGPVAMQILGHVMGQETRTAKAVLQEARRRVGRKTTFRLVPLRNLAFFAHTLRTL